MNDNEATAVPHNTRCVCDGEGKWHKYFKDEKKKIVTRLEEYCPVCHPNLAQPIIAGADYVEIQEEEYRSLDNDPLWTTS